MSRPRLVVATRSTDKLREIRNIARVTGEWEIVGLRECGIEPEPGEEGIEIFDTFTENALAKARYFAARLPELVIADDSGLCVEALGGAPGVRSRRFAPGEGGDRDAANNAHLLSSLEGVPAEERGAHYVCALAAVQGERELGSWEGRCHGVILERPRGSGGFGYDPLFFLPGEDATFGELSSERKNRVSHRALAVRAALSDLGKRH